MLLYFVVVFIVVAITRLVLIWSIRMCKCKVSMAGKVAVVTGANSGIGYCTALELARKGARVILACRDAKRAKAACDSIIALTGNTEISYSHLDLSSLASVRNFAKYIIDAESKLDVLVNNAGGYGEDRYTADGIIEGMQANYFGHFLLTLLLLPLLKNSESGRIVNLSSLMHFLGDINLKHINERGYYKKMLVYSNSKLCSLVFSVELSKRLQGTKVTANAVHPGVIWTGIMVSGTSRLDSMLFSLWCWFYNRTAEQGAQTVVHVCVSEECGRVSGKYFVDCAERFTSPKTKNGTLGKTLWDYSEKIVQYTNDETD